ncbi:MAG: hypothetical protein LBQ68_00755, partial [Clostridiales bacterium]|nr:hypothetical protein [Clostridiales bacterium]
QTDPADKQEIKQYISKRLRDLFKKYYFEVEWFLDTILGITDLGGKKSIIEKFYENEFERIVLAYRTGNESLCELLDLSLNYTLIANIKSFGFDEIIPGEGIYLIETASLYKNFFDILNGLDKDKETFPKSRNITEEKILTFHIISFIEPNSLRLLRILQEEKYDQGEVCGIISEIYHRFFRRPDLMSVMRNRLLKTTSSGMRKEFYVFLENKKAENSYGWRNTILNRLKPYMEGFMF